MIFQFARPDKIMNWLRAKGYGTGTLEDRMNGYFKATSGLNVGTIEDHYVKALSIAGFNTGTIKDRTRKMLVTRTGISDFKDAERAFFLNTSLDMFS